MFLFVCFVCFVCVCLAVMVGEVIFCLFRRERIVLLVEACNGFFAVYFSVGAIFS